MGGVLCWESAAAQHREHLAAFSMGVQSTVWVYSLQHGYTAFSMGVHPAEWLYSLQSGCTACGMGVQSTEWVYSLQHGCTTRSTGVQPAVWLYSLRHSLQPVAHSMGVQPAVNTIPYRQGKLGMLPRVSQQKLLLAGRCSSRGASTCHSLGQLCTGIGPSILLSPDRWGPAGTWKAKPALSLSLGQGCRVCTWIHICMETVSAKSKILVSPDRVSTRRASVVQKEGAAVSNSFCRGSFFSGYVLKEGLKVRGENV